MSAHDLLDARETEDEAEPALSLGALEDAAGFVMRIAQLTAFERFFAALGGEEIRISEFTVLFAIQQNPGIRQGQVADVLKIKWSNMTRLVRSLEDRGLVARHVPPNDRRSVTLSVTPAGARQIAASSLAMYRAEKAALAMLDPAEYATLLALSRKIAGWPQGRGMPPGAKPGE